MVNNKQLNHLSACNELFKDNNTRFLTTCLAYLHIDNLLSFLNSQVQIN